MPRIQPLDASAAPAKSQEIYASIKGALGGVPAMFQTLGHSPAALGAMWGFFGAMGQSSLSAGLREQIALAVGQTNGCGYCVNAHTALGKKAGLADADMLAARRGSANDPKSSAALKLATAILERKGHVSDADVSAARQAGFNDAQILEILSVVVQNVFTNWVNHVAQTKPDFPEAPALR